MINLYNPWDAVYIKIANEMVSKLLQLRCKQDTLIHL